MPNSAVVTGASSGIGQAIVVKLAQAGWRVAAVGRREQELKKTAVLSGEMSKNVLAIPCDVSDPDAVAKMAERVFDAFGSVQALVNGAGVNTPDRSWKAISLATYRHVMEVNVTGAFLCIQAFLPPMREQKTGTIVNIVSDSAIQASAKAGAAYVMSKYAMRGMTQSLNAEERQSGVRATAIYPGDVDTPLLQQRPTPPAPEQRRLMMQPEDIADCAMLAINLPPRAVIEELLIRPR
jgi:NAD(P)-dependent dehydrogenase (short-subunit alcohol dehydrogenase family)